MSHPEQPNFLDRPFFPLDPEMTDMMLRAVDNWPDPLVRLELGSMEWRNNRLLGAIALDLNLLDEDAHEDYLTGAALTQKLARDASADPRMTTLPVIEEETAIATIGARAKAISDRAVAELEATGKTHGSASELLEELYMPYFAAEPDLRDIIVARSYARRYPDIYVLGGACVVAYLRAAALESGMEPL